MIATAPLQRSRVCTVKRFGAAWAVGTGLPVGIEQGEYRITGEVTVDGASYMNLDGTYHCPVSVCEEVAWRTDDGHAPAVTRA